MSNKNSRKSGHSHRSKKLDFKLKKQGKLNLIQQKEIFVKKRNNQINMMKNSNYLESKNSSIRNGSNLNQHPNRDNQMN